MNNFKQYKRKGLSEMVAFEDFQGFMDGVSISEPDKKLSEENYEEFKQGFIARNPKNHEDLWYVAKKYFDDNLEEAEPKTAPTETFFDRLIAERDQLCDKLLKLEGFLSDKENAAKISGQTQVAMLIEQHQHMFKYLNILDKRIEDLAPKESN